MPTAITTRTGNKEPRDLDDQNRALNGLSVPMLDAVALKKATDSAQLLKVEQVMQLLGLSRTTVYDLISKGTLLSVTVGRSRRFRRRDLDRFVDGLTS